MPHNRKIILLVDDDAEFISELQESLALSGYIPVTAVNGAEAIKLALKIKPDLVLLDLKLGKENGILVAEKIRKYPVTSRIPIIMISGYFNGREGLSLPTPSNVNIYLSKPFSQKDVVRSIQGVLEDDEEASFDVVRYMVEKSRKKTETAY
ncbi:MAG: hypothetical protein A2270_11185 [Elusimicrobia bacterium RIFOXYA12_FULL_51_18]|nr:MAG: hypothetical protein A2270_11185 [Elusimicrobia bacterium RIFOXYA12_FULL_51_18]OGS30306.1 MAG: hypothetical protein A2218_01415 [Elusimicrobia bacterium RIFOXYA2_FULL_53_38]